MATYVSRFSKGRFLSRLISWAVLWTMICVLVETGFDSGCWALIASFGMAAQWEFYDLQQKRGHYPLSWLGLITGLALFLSSWVSLVSPYADPSLEPIRELAILVIGSFLAIVRLVIWPKADYDLLASVGTTLMGVLYIPFMFNFVVLIAFHQLPLHEHAFWLIYLVAVTKFTDAGAYVFGTFFGRHKMVPLISPGKTWEGFVGGILTGLGFSGCLVWLWGWQYLVTAPGGPWLWALLLGIILPIVGTLGDLAESVIKRDVGVKDSGGMVPGIGGALDLIDSLLFAAPMLYLLLLLTIWAA